MKYSILILFITIASFCSGAVKDTITANNNLIEYTGRIDFSDSLAPKFSYSGVSIKACFNGTSISAILNDDKGENYYNVILNGEVISAIEVSTGKKEYVLAEGLEDKTHEIELFKRTELTFGKTQFLGFLVDEGKTLSPIVNTRDLLFEFIGNSITCGYGNEGENGDDFLAETENHYLTYAAKTARNFNARHMAVSRSGIGVYRNYDGPATGSDECMTNLYTNIFLYDNNPKYDFAIQPDLVCINLGTNDFSTTGADSALYVSNYLRLIDTIQTKYDMPEIICLVGPMMSNPDLATIKGYLEFIADSANNKGKGNVSFFEMSAQTGDLGIAVHWHPTVAQHMRNADELTNYIKELKGWAIQTQISSAKAINAKQIQLEFNTEIDTTTKDFSGFTFSDGTNNLTIKEISIDNGNAQKLNFTIEESLNPDSELKLDYAPGTIESTEGVKLNELHNVEVENTLTETSIKETFIKSDGIFIRLKFNKYLSPDCTIDGLTFYNNDENYHVDSFQISSTKLTCYINPIVVSTDQVFYSYSGSGIFGRDDQIILSGCEDVEIENTSTVTSVNESNVVRNFKIWPNPNKDGVFNYKVQNEEKRNYEIVNQNGSIMAKGILAAAEGQFSLERNVPSGIYFLRINSSEQVEVHELIITN